MELRSNEIIEGTEVTSAPEWGIQGGANLNNLVRLEGNLVSTGVGFSIGRENYFHHPLMYKRGMPIKQSAGIGALGFTASVERTMVGMYGGADELTDKTTTTHPILPGIISGFNETNYNPDGTQNHKNGLVIGVSGALIFGFSLSVKYYFD